MHPKDQKSNGLQNKPTSNHRLDWMTVYEVIWIFFMLHSLSQIPFWGSFCFVPKISDSLQKSDSALVTASRIKKKKEKKKDSGLVSS